MPFQTKEEAFSGVALYLMRLPFCPPLPLVCAENRVCSSHDLLASVYINVPHNRHAGEGEIYARFKEALSQGDFFNLCCKSTVELLGFATSRTLGAQFKRPEDVCQGDAVHIAMAHYCTGQSIILDSTPVPFDTYKLKSYMELLEIHKQRCCSAACIS